MTFLLLLSSLISLTLSELVSDRACFNAKDKHESTIFSIENEGVIEGIRLTFLSGGVTCVLAGQLTHWGCVGLYSATYLYKVTSEQLHEGYELYPKIKGFVKSPLLPSGTASDNVVPIDTNLGFYRFNDLSKNWDAPVLEIRNPVYAVDHGDKFMLQYSEAYRNKANVDNSGTTCVRVEFLYSHSYDKVTLDDPACFFANDKEKSTIFAVPHEGMLAGIDMEFDYTSGQQGVQCLVGVPKSHWGCEYTHDIEVWLYKVDHGHNGSPIFPKQGTRGYQLVSSVWDSYWLSGFDRDSGRIVLMDPPTYVTPPMDLMLQYGEAYKRIDTYNNQGATCAKVHLIYQKHDFAKKKSLNNDNEHPPGIFGPFAKKGTMDKDNKDYPDGPGLYGPFAKKETRNKDKDYPDGPGLYGPFAKKDTIYPDGPGLYGPFAKKETMDKDNKGYPDGPGLYGPFAKKASLNNGPFAYQDKPILNDLNNDGSLQFIISDKHTSKIIIGLSCALFSLMLCTCVLFYLYIFKVTFKSKDIGYNINAVDNTCV